MKIHFEDKYKQITSLVKSLSNGYYQIVEPAIGNRAGKLVVVCGHKKDGSDKRMLDLSSLGNFWESEAKLTVRRLNPDETIVLFNEPELDTEEEPKQTV